jgi:predicted DNA repair protein MutK
MLGGCYLCFEGFEAVSHKLLHKKSSHNELHEALLDPAVDMKTFEKDKIKGAIRTDFILSAEIIVIALGTAQGADFVTQALVVSGIALAMTIGVYSLVAGIVKLDDGAMLLMASKTEGLWGRIKRGFGDYLLSFCPKLMRGLSVVGTAAMFLVGGGIIVHGVPALHHFVNHSAEVTDGLPAIGHIISALTPTLLNAMAGVIAGGILVAIMSLLNWLRR